MRVMSWRGGVGVAVLLGVTVAFALQQGGRLPGLDFSGKRAPSNVTLVTARSNAPTSGGLAGTGQPDLSRSSATRLPQAGAPHFVAVPIIAIGSYQQVLINRDRAGNGLGALSWSSCLYAEAVASARRMAAQGYISHTNGPWVDLGCRLGAQAGENVGWWSGGVTDTQLNSMFMASPDHRANIMGPYHYVATAWVVAANGSAYIAVEFG